MILTQVIIELILQKTCPNTVMILWLTLFYTTGIKGWQRSACLASLWTSHTRTQAGWLSGGNSKPNTNDCDMYLIHRHLNLGSTGRYRQCNYCNRAYIYNFPIWLCKILTQWHSGVRCLQRPLCSTPSHRAKDFRLVLLSKPKNEQLNWIDIVSILITSRW